MLPFNRRFVMFHFKQDAFCFFSLKTLKSVRRSILSAINSFSIADAYVLKEATPFEGSIITKKTTLIKLELLNKIKQKLRYSLSIKKKKFKKMVHTKHKQTKNALFAVHKR